MSNILSIEELSDMQKELECSASTIIDDSLRTTHFHTKYIKLLAMHRYQMNRYEREKIKLEKELDLYYSGKASEEVYKERPFNLKVMKSDLYKFINADDRMLDINLKMNDLKIVIDMLNDTVKHIKERTFAIKNAVEMIKFQNGQ